MQNTKASITRHLKTNRYLEIASSDVMNILRAIFEELDDYENRKLIMGSFHGKLPAYVVRQVNKFTKTFRVTEIYVRECDGELFPILYTTEEWVVFPTEMPC